MIMTLNEIYNMMGKLDPSYNLITEAISVKDAYSKFYIDFDPDTYQKIINMDSSNINNMTPLRKWLLDQYRNEEFDLYTVNDIVSKYNSFPDDIKASLSPRFSKSNPNRFKNMTDFSDTIVDTISKGKNKTKSQQVSNDTIILYEDDEWIIVSPLTLESSKKWGAGSHWCTAGSDTASFYFYDYVNPSSPYDGLVIFRNKKDISESIQICVNFKNGYISSSADFKDNPMDLTDFRDAIEHIGLNDEAIRHIIYNAQDSIEMLLDSKSGYDIYEKLENGAFDIAKNEIKKIKQRNNEATWISYVGWYDSNMLKESISDLKGLLSDELEFYFGEEKCLLSGYDIYSESYNTPFVFFFPIEQSSNTLITYYGEPFFITEDCKFIREGKKTFSVDGVFSDGSTKRLVIDTENSNVYEK